MDMQQVTVGMDPTILSVLRERAHASGLTLEDVLSDELRHLLGPRRTMPPMAILDAVAERTRAGQTDAEMADDLHYMPGRIAELRRSLGLPANRRYRKREVA